MKSFKIEERSNGDIIWNGIPLEKLSGSRLHIREDAYNISTDIQNVFIDTTEDSVTN